MTITLITNTFSNYQRQNVAADSWRRLKAQFPGIVKVVNLQFADEQEGYVDHYPDFETVFSLTRSSQTVLPNASKKLPFISDLFAEGLKQDSDYFIVTNSDVIVMPSLIQYIIDNRPAAIPCSRLDIEPIDSFNRVLMQEIRPIRWEIAGFDTFVFAKTWAETYKEHFLKDYFLGKPAFDVVWAGYIKLFGNNVPLMNDYPPKCFHINHGISSVTTECAERDWNLALVKANVLDTLMNNVMFLHLKNNLLRRQPWGAFLYPSENEKAVERSFFDVMSVVYPVHQIVNPTPVRPPDDYV